jgi:hypothetical protein
MPTTTRPAKFFTVMLFRKPPCWEKCLSCYSESRHVGRNARHVAQKAAMLHISPSCYVSGRPVNGDPVLSRVSAFYLTLSSSDAVSISYFSVCLSNTETLSSPECVSGDNFLSCLSNCVSVSSPEAVSNNDNQ